MTDRRDEERRDREAEHLDDLLDDIEEGRGHPTRSDRAEDERQRKETERRGEELRAAWRRRRKPSGRGGGAV